MACRPPFDTTINYDRRRQASCKKKKRQPMSDLPGPIRRIGERSLTMDTTFNLPTDERDRLFAAGVSPNLPSRASERVPSAEQERPISKTKLRVGRVTGGLVVAFLLFDSIPKILQLAWVVKATTEFGFPVGAILPIGVVLLLCTVLYCIPRTAILGAVLLTGYLGGAVEANVHASLPLASHTLFPIYFAVFIWGSLALRDRRVWRIFERSRPRRE
jgi:hypothetical protein